MRGAQPYRCLLIRNGRIIPADAGSTGRDEDRVDVFEDHPRGCGEHNSQER